MATLVVVRVGSVREVRPLGDVALRQLLVVFVLAVAGVKLERPSRLEGPLPCCASAAN
ncbi:MAG TPA: hypothetical protein VKP69_28070 [Isosphaeraceae bacterium]|nr:hypothetical protein [Isosphaeraceae bacterium]